MDGTNCKPASLQTMDGTNYKPVIAAPPTWTTPCFKSSASTLGHEGGKSIIKFVESSSSLWKSQMVSPLHWIGLKDSGKNKTRRTGEEGQRGSSKKFAHRGICCPVKHWLPNLTSLGHPVLDPTEALQGKKTWYSETPVGVNKINSFLKNMTVEAGLSTTSKHFTNHSIRKTTVEKLQIAGVLNDNIASITGHKNEKSLKDYAETDIDDHVAISIILSQPVTTQPYGPFHMQPPSIRYVQLPTIAPCMSLQNAVPHVQLPTSFILCMQLQYSFNSCSVFFGGSCTTSIELNCNPSVPSRKHPHFSDEWYFISVYRTWVWTYVIFIIINL